MTEFVYGKMWASQGHTKFHEDAEERKTVAASKGFAKVKVAVSLTSKLTYFSL